MAIDIRATVTCSLGTLISASLNDDYVQGTGLIKCKGTCEIDGLITPAPGTVVTFTYTKGGVTRTIPRQVLVISSFADPLRRTTKVQLGCRFTYLQNKKDPIQWDQYDDPENANVTAAEAAIITSPIYASSVAAQCMTALGISGNIVLTNKFSIPQFDFSSGYVNVLSDLMVSECKCGYIDGSGNFQVFNLNVTGGTGPVIDSTKIIDIAEIGVGQPPGSAVTVSYSTLKLNDPPPEPLADPGGPGDAAPAKTPEQKKRDWELDEIIGSETTIVINYTSSDNNAIAYTFKYIPYQSTQTEYDSWDRVIKRTTIDRKIGAVTNTGYVQAAADFPGAGGTARAYGNSIKETQTITVINYKLQPGPYPLGPNGVPYRTIGVFDTLADLPETAEQNDVAIVKSTCYQRYFWNGSWQTLPAEETEKQQALPEGYDAIVSEVTTVVEPIDAVLGAVAPSYVDENNNFVSLPDGENTISSRTTIIYEQKGRSVVVANESASLQQLNIPVTKTITKTEKAYAYTAYGQQDLAQRAQQGQTVISFKNSALQLVEDGVELRLVSGREATLQTRPSKQQQILADSAKSTGGGGAAPTAADENGGYSVSSKSELELAVGGDTLNRIELSLPYAPDDTFSRSGSCPTVTYTASPSDAPSKAANFGRAQNRMLLGNRYGMNIQLAPEHLPAAPFAPIMVQLSGLTALYRINGTSWTMSGEGIVAATDAMFWGAVGGTGTFWFPVAPGITTLPATPAVVDGQMTVTNVVPVWNETVKTEATTFVGLTITSLSYALSVLTEVPALTTKTGLIAARIRKVVVPAATPVAIAAYTPAISTGAKVAPPATSIGLAALTPTVSGGGSVSVPFSTLSIAGVVPEITGMPSISVFVPTVDTTVAALAPTVSGGGSVAVPAKDTTIVSSAPSIVIFQSDPNFSSVSLLLHMDGANNSTTFTDSSSNNLTVGNSSNLVSVDTAQSKFGGASARFDGAEALTAPSSSTSAVFAFGTGDFTAECWFRITSHSSTARYLFVFFDGSATFSVILNSSNLLVMLTSSTARLTGSSPAVDTWHHVAITRVSSVCRLFLNGVQQGGTYTTALSVGNARIDIAQNQSGSQRFTGWIDDLRVTKGVARYTAGFTPPTAAFPDA